MIDAGEHLILLSYLFDLLYNSQLSLVICAVVRIHILNALVAHWYDNNFVLSVVVCDVLILVSTLI